MTDQKVLMDPVPKLQSCPSSHGHMTTIYDIFAENLPLLWFLAKSTHNKQWVHLTIMDSLNYHGNSLNNPHKKNCNIRLVLSWPSLWSLQFITVMDRIHFCHSVEDYLNKKSQKRISSSSSTNGFSTNYKKSVSPLRQSTQGEQPWVLTLALL